MNGAHVHLLLNHIPVLGSFFALCLLLYGVFARSKPIVNAALFTVIIATLIGIPAYLSGEEAEHVVKPVLGINHDALEEHEEMAEIALWVMLMNGVIALGALVTGRKKEAAVSPLTWVALAGLLITTVLMARTGGSGGEIRHSEINLTVDPTDH